MTPADVLVRVIERLGMTAEGAHVFTADEVQAWPSDVFDALADSDLLIPSAPASSVECDGCEEACVMPVEVVRTDPGKPSRAFIVCDKPGDYGRIPVSIECLRRWRTDTSRWASFIAAQLQADQTPREVVPGALWELGRISTPAGECDGYFASGTALTDVTQVSAISAVIRDSTAPLILAPSTPPTRDPLSGAAVLSLRRVLCLQGGRVLVDRQAIETTLARHLKTDSVQGNVFRRDGDYWTISYEGGAPFRLRDAKGLRYIAYLLSRRDEEVHAIDLVAAISPREPSPGAASHDQMTRQQLGEVGLSISTTGSAGEMVDRQTAAEVRRRLEKLRDEREEAMERGNTDRLSAIDAETEKIEDYYSGALDIRGRSRVAASDSERARKSVGKAIARALARIKAHSEELHCHLSKALLTGEVFVYRPERTTLW